MDRVGRVTLAGTDLAGLIGSRICHDLVSPIGAIGNGIELMSMLGSSAPPGNSAEMQLVNESCEHANARIRFFRVAFGWAGDTRPVPGREIAAVLRDYTRGARLQADWATPEMMERREAQLGFLAHLCFETAMPTGGRIRLNRDAEVLSVAAAEGVVRIDPDLWAVLTGSDLETQITPASVQFPLLAALARDQGRAIGIDAEEPDRLRLTV